MKKAADVLHFSKSMGKILDKYGDDVRDAVRHLVKRAGNEARDRLKQTSPSKSGKYAEGWSAGSYALTPGGATVTVYNALKPGLVHLLENGHVLRRGGRVLPHSPVKPKVHVAPVEEEVGRELEKNVRQAIENGS